MQKEKKDWRGPLALRGVLCCAAVAVQALIQSPSLDYGRARMIKNLILYAGPVIFILGVAALWRSRKKPLYGCAALDCAGLSVSFLGYWKFITNFAGDSVAQLRRFILTPYLLCFCLSWGLWGIYRHTEFRFGVWLRRKAAGGLR